MKIPKRPSSINLTNFENNNIIEEYYTPTPKAPKEYNIYYIGDTVIISPPGLNEYTATIVKVNQHSYTVQPDILDKQSKYNSLQDWHTSCIYPITKNSQQPIYFTIP